MQTVFLIGTREMRHQAKRCDIGGAREPLSNGMNFI